MFLIIVLNVCSSAHGPWLTFSGFSFLLSVEGSSVSDTFLILYVILSNNFLSPSMVIEVFVSNELSTLASGIVETFLLGCCVISSSSLIDKVSIKCICFSSNVTIIFDGWRSAPVAVELGSTISLKITPS